MVFAKNQVPDYVAIMDWIHSFFSVPEGTTFFLFVLLIIKKLIAAIGVLVIFFGAAVAIYNFCGHRKSTKRLNGIDRIRLEFGRTIILGLEFIVAADVIATTTAPDYYSVGILASLVGIRTLLTYFMNRELRTLSSIEQ